MRSWSFGHIFRTVGHVNPAFFFRRHQTDRKWLDDWHQRHVGVRRHRDRAHIVGMHDLGNQNGSRSIRRTDDSNRCRIPEFKSHQRCRTDRKENAKLRRRTK